MDAQRLRKKGWSEQEISHAKGIFDKAEEQKHPEIAFGEHVRLWTLLFILLVGTLGAVIGLLPVLLFLKPMLSTLIIVGLGGCFGLLLGGGLSVLKIHPKHHRHGVSILIVLMVVVLTIGFALLEKRYAGLPGVWLPNPLALGLIFTFAMTIPYTLDRRLHGPV
jgi:VIT1/CCC1 family predicted Fe2+/Mn2+ transporter